MYSLYLSCVLQNDPILTFKWAKQPQKSLLSACTRQTKKVAEGVLSTLAASTHTNLSTGCAQGPICFIIFNNSTNRTSVTQYNHYGQACLLSAMSTMYRTAQYLHTKS